MRMSKDAIESKRHHPGETTRDDTPLRAFLFSLAVASPLVSLGLLSLLLLLGPVLTGADVTDVLLTFEVVVDIWFTKDETIYNIFNLQLSFLALSLRLGMAIHLHVAQRHEIICTC